MTANCLFDYNRAPYRFKKEILHVKPHQLAVYCLIGGPLLFQLRKYIFWQVINVIRLELDNLLVLLNEQARQLHFVQRQTCILVSIYNVLNLFTSLERELQVGGFEA